MAKLDPEILALTAVERAIAGLSESAASRVLRTAMERSLERQEAEKRAQYAEQSKQWQGTNIGSLALAGAQMKQASDYVNPQAQAQRLNLKEESWAGAQYIGSTGEKVAAAQMAAGIKDEIAASIAKAKAEGKRLAADAE